MQATSSGDSFLWYPIRFAGSYERECLPAAFDSHFVVEPLRCGKTLVGLPLDPVDGETDGGAAKQSKIESRPAGADATLVFLSTDIQTQMQAVLDPPVFSVQCEHRYGIEFLVRQTRE